MGGETDDFQSTRKRKVEMTIEDLQKQLDNYPTDTIIIAFDPEIDNVIPITGLLYDPNKNTLELCTDDND